MNEKMLQSQHLFLVLVEAIPGAGVGWVGLYQVPRGIQKNSCPLKCFQQTMYSALIELTLVLGLAGWTSLDVKKQKSLHRDDVD